MDYPGSKLTRPIRRAILLVFFAIFFISSPLLILYTAGYRYDWQNGYLKATGAISVDVLPTFAEVAINGAKINQDIPIRLKNLTPSVSSLKKYEIKISAPGYYDWIKEEEVKSKQTVYIKEINLLQKNEPQLLIDKPIDYFSLSPDGRYIIYSFNNGTGQEISLFDTRRTEDTPLLTFTGEQAIKVTWAKNNYYAAISHTEAPYEKIIIVNAENPRKQLDLTKKIKSSISKYQWKESLEPELFFSTKTKIMSVSPTTEQLYNLAANTYLDWHMENGQLWSLVYTTSTQKLLLTKDTLGFSTIFFDNLNDYLKINNQDNLQILEAKNGHVLLKYKNRLETALVTANQIYQLPGEQVKISYYNDWWLIWTPWELWTYSDGETPKLLTRSGETLQNVIPLDKYNTLATVWRDRTTALFPYYLVGHDLLNFVTTQTDADSNKKLLYFTGEFSGKKGLWNLKY